MNESSANNSKCPHTVVSKFFSSSPVMDESLTEFKEKKKGNTGPKTASKPAARKGVKKSLKRPKGQKDIKTALKQSKNDLLNYAKEFDQVCKQSGLDVDSEQLQLAIALSKSEIETVNDCTNSQSAQSSSSTQRARRIRNTLQDYGFNVPDIKIKSNKRQKKKYRTDYKLLQVTDAEKQQIISDRYCQVLFENVYETKTKDNSAVTDNYIYYISTNITYIELKNNDVLYVNELVEKSTSNGVLLKDWATIPGRPESPKVSDQSKMNFSEIECSQEELDIVLSGTLKSAKNVVQSKTKLVDNDPPIIIIDDDKKSLLGNKNELFEHSEHDTTNILSKSKNNIEVQNIDSTHALDRVRSKSPDIFDDEVSVIWDSKGNNGSMSEFTKNNSISESLPLNKSTHTNYVKQSTSVAGNCQVNDSSNNEENSSINVEKNINSTEKNNRFENMTMINHAKDVNLLSQENNITRRNSNDYMEITECVVISDASTNHTFQNKNKTQRTSNDFMEITDCVDKVMSNPVDIDLTQNSDEKNELNPKIATVVNITDKIVDLSQSSNSEDDLPSVVISESQSRNHSLDDTIILNHDEIAVNYNSVKSPDQSLNQSRRDKSLSSLDLTQTPPSQLTNVRAPSSQSFFEDFIHVHSDDSNKEGLDTTCKTDANEKDTKSGEIEPFTPNLETSNIKENVKVDLTQSSNSSDDTINDKSINSIDKGSVNASLGKKDDISIDYDDMVNVNGECREYTGTDNNLSQQSLTYDITDDNEVNAMGSCSESSKVFDLSDKELEYSPNKSMGDVLDVNFGGISVIDNMPDVRDNNLKTNPNGTRNTSMSDSFLPEICLKKPSPFVKKVYTNKLNNENIDDICRSNTDTELPCQASPYKVTTKENIFSTTPKNSEYIIKTDSVTPMLNYSSMSTPDMNRELDKYGLKPFKRKRAIQLLTHLYNQTHPVVESLQEGLPSPSKKRKHDEPSPVKRKSPRKLMKSPPTPVRKNPPNENDDVTDSSNVYEITNDVPEIKDIACSEGDWVFQKREKAKLHSCRVPLHIAFHNYVTCRRRLQESILKYEPVNIDVIHKGLVASGHRYDPKELLKYMDKKCITVKTADNNTRNNR